MQHIDRVVKWAAIGASFYFGSKIALRVCDTIDHGRLIPSDRKKLTKFFSSSPSWFC